MTGVWLMIVVLGAATLAWSIYVVRASRVASTEVAGFIAGLRTSAGTPDVHVARLQAATERIESARVEIEGAGAKLGQTLEAWSESLRRTAGELEVLPERVPANRHVGTSQRLTGVGSRRAPVAFADAKFLQLPNRSPQSKDTSRRDPRDTLGLSWDQPVTLVVPTLRVPPSSMTSARWAVSTEDMLAVQTLDKRLLTRWPEAQIKTRVTDDLDERKPPQGNVCSVCRDRRNPVTAALLDHERTRQLFGFRMGFEATLEDEAGGPIEWGITFGEAAPLTSPSYEQNKDLAQQGAGDDKTVLEDVALLAGFPNPWGSGRALVIAGIRTFGTWGAAEYLCRNFEEIYDRTEGRNFAYLLRVRATYQVHQVVAEETKELLLVVAEDPAPTIEELDFREAA